MPRIKGPMQSLDTSGTFAGQLTFAVTKGRAYVKKRSTPSNPKTIKQTIARAWLRWLGTTWSTLAMTNPRTTWQATATEQNLSGINVFIAENMSGDRTNYGPHQSKGQIGGGTPITLVGTPIVTPLVRAYKITDQYVFKHDGWGFRVRALRTDVSPNYDQELPMMPHGATVKAHVSQQLPLESGTYTFTFTTFTTQGALAAAGTRPGVIIP